MDAEEMKRQMGFDKFKEDREKRRRKSWWATYRAALPAAMWEQIVDTQGGRPRWNPTTAADADARAGAQADLVHGTMERGPNVYERE